MNKDTLYLFEAIKVNGNKNEFELQDLAKKHLLCLVDLIYSRLNNSFDNRILYEYQVINSDYVDFNFKFNDNSLIVEPEFIGAYISFFPVTFYKGDDANEIVRKINDIKVSFYMGRSQDNN